MNKIVVITGGTRGIGKEIVTKFASAGYNVVTCSRNNEELEKLKKDIEEKYDNVQFFTKCCDLSLRKDIQDFADYIVGISHEIEVLVNNSGVFIPGEIHTEEEGALEKMIHTNLYSAYHLTRSLIGSMITRKKGHIFNMCSIASLHAYPNGGSYSISKFALYGMTKALREEMKPKGIRVTAVLPGATLTSSWDGVDLPPERFMKPQDIAEAVFSTWKLSDRTVVEDLVLRPQLGDI